MLFSLISLLAEGEQAQPGNPLTMFVPMILIFVALYLIVLRPAQKRDRLQRETLLTSLKKNDRVLIQAGIIGTIASVSEKEDEVTLKIDESANVRIRVLKSSIARNYTAEETAREQAAAAKAPDAKGTEEAIKAAK